MPNFDSGVKGFIVGEFTVKVNFPIDFKDRADVACKYCNYYSTHSRQCQLTKDVVPYPEKFVAPTCPLTIND